MVVYTDFLEAHLLMLKLKSYLIYVLMKRRLAVLGVALLFIFILYIASSSDQDTQTLEPLRIRRGTITEAVYGVGTVVPDRVWQLKINQAAVIEEIFVREGDYVQKGDLLLNITSLGMLRAPFDGMITALNFKLNEMVFAQSTVLTLTDLHHTHVEVVLEQKAATYVQKGQEVKLNFESLGEQNFTGLVDALYPKGNQFIARISVQGLTQKILPSMTADVSIFLNKRNDVLLAPVIALSKQTLWVQRNGSLKKVPIVSGIITGKEVEIVSGEVSENDIVVIRE